MSTRRGSFFFLFPQFFLFLQEVTGLHPLFFLAIQLPLRDSNLSFLFLFFLFFSTWANFFFFPSWETWCFHFATCLFWAFLFLIASLSFPEFLLRYRGFFPSNKGLVAGVPLSSLFTTMGLRFAFLSPVSPGIFSFAFSFGQKVGVGEFFRFLLRNQSFFLFGPLFFSL